MIYDLWLGIQCRPAGAANAQCSSQMHCMRTLPFVKVMYWEDRWTGAGRDWRHFRWFECIAHAVVNSTN